MKYVGFCNQVNHMNKEYIQSNSLEILGVTQEKEIRVDIQLNKMEKTTIWGKVSDVEGNPLYGECVKLIRINEEQGERYLEIVDSILTDCEGEYKLDAFAPIGEGYTVIVDKMPQTLEIKENKAQDNIKDNKNKFDEEIYIQRNKERDCNEQKLKIKKTKVYETGSQQQEPQMIKYNKKTYSSQQNMPFKKYTAISQYTVFSK